MADYRRWRWQRTLTEARVGEQAAEHGVSREDPVHDDWMAMWSEVFTIMEEAP